MEATVILAIMVISEITEVMVISATTMEEI